MNSLTSFIVWNSMKGLVRQNFIFILCGGLHADLWPLACPSSLQQLITRNADYLVNSVALQLRNSVHLEAIQVLQAVLKYG